MEHSCLQAEDWGCCSTWEAFRKESCLYSASCRPWRAGYDSLSCFCLLPSSFVPALFPGSARVPLCSQQQQSCRACAWSTEGEGHHDKHTSGRKYINPKERLGSEGFCHCSAQLCGSAEAEHHISPTMTLSYTLSTSAKASCCTALKSHRSRSAPGSCCPPSSDQHRVLLMTLQGFNETAQPAGK